VGCNIGATGAAVFDVVGEYAIAAAKTK